MSRFRLSVACLAIVLGMASQAFGSSTISSIFPTSGPAGAGSFPLTVNGTNFTSRTVVYFGSCPGVVSTYKSPTQMVATIPSACMAAAGTIGIQVADPSYGTSNAVAFQIYQGTGGFAILTSSIPGGTAGTAYSATLQASGGTAPYSWTHSGGTLPPGLALSSAGTISGTPSANGSYSFSVTVKDLAAHSATANYSISLRAAPLTISTTSLPGGTAGTAYSATLAASGGTSPYTWSVSSGALPAGLTLSAAGVISGTPSATGSNSFVAQVTDSASHFATYTYSASVAAPPLTVSTTSVPGGTAGTAYSATLAATGGNSPYSWTVSSGALPAGLTLSSAGAISGTPTTSGSYSFTAQVNDSSSHSATYNFSTSVAASPITFSSNSVPSGAVTEAYSTTLIAGGGTPPYNWSLSSGALPAGLTLSSVGVISGTPTTSGSYSFTAQVNDSASHTATQNYSTSVASQLAIKAGDFLPNGTAGTVYRAMQLQVTGGIAPYTWTWVAGPQQDLPMGLTMYSNGAVGGTPAEVGTFTPSVTVTDSAGATATQVFTFTIAAAVCTTCVQ